MMSADEALERLRKIVEDFKDDIFDYDDLEALKIAIAALEEKVGG